MSKDIPYHEGEFSETDKFDVYNLLFPNISMPEIPLVRSNLNKFIYRADEMLSVQVSARKIDEYFRYGIIHRVDLNSFLISTLPEYLRNKNPQQIPLPNNGAILQELEEGERMVGAIKHKLIGTLDLGSIFLRATGASTILDKYPDMKITTVGVVNQENKPTAIIHYYHGGGGGRPGKVFSSVTSSAKI